MTNLTPPKTETTDTSATRVTRLNNGLRVATSKLPIRTVTVAVFANVGARNETEAENGLSHFLEHMAFKGTPTRTAKDIVLTVEKLGADINAFTSKNMTAYYVVGLADHTGTALDILSDVVLNSVFDPKDVESEKDVVVQEIYESMDDISDLAHNALNLTAYPDQALGRTILGPEETVRSFTQDMLKSYMGRNYHALNLVVTAVGDVDHEAFVAEVEARFSTVQAYESLPAARAAYVGGTSLVQDERFEQSHVYLGFKAPGTACGAGFAKFDLLSDALGGGMSAPLFQEVREARGLCYSVGAGMIPQNDESLFIIRGATTPENLNDFLTTCCAELAKIAAGGLTDDDWERARNQVVRVAAQRDEKALLAARAAASDLFNHGRVRTTDEVIAMYRSVSREDVIEAARELLSVNPTIVIAGNAPEHDYTNLVRSSLMALAG